MKLLVDTHIFIEILLNQAKANEARTFLENRKGHELFVSDFALHSIGLLLFRHKQYVVFRQFLQDLVYRVGVVEVSLTTPEMDAVVDLAAKFGMDFDDAYQYGAALKHGLKIVNFDADFDRTSEGRLLPAAVL